MNTVLVWILVIGTGSGLPNVIPEQNFATKGDCEIVRNTVIKLNKGFDRYSHELVETKCVNVNIVVSK